jgi:hypothetical protein
MRKILRLSSYPKSGMERPLYCPIMILMKAEKDKPTISTLKTLCTLIQNDPSNKQLHRVFAGLLKKINPGEHSFFSSFQPGLYNALEILFLRDRVNHYQLATFASRQLSLKYQFDFWLQKSFHQG